MYKCLENPSIKVSVLPDFRYFATGIWWRHQMETFSALLALCTGDSQVTGEFSAQRPVTQTFDVFFHSCLNKRLSKQSWGWWFETPSRSLWRHYNEYSKNLRNLMPGTQFIKLLCTQLTHWGGVMHICVSRLNIIGSDNGLSLCWHQCWNVVNLVLETNFSEMLTEIHTFSFKKTHVKMVSISSGPQCVNTLRPRWNARHFVGDILECIKIVFWM